ILSRKRSQEPYLHIRLLRQVSAVDEANLAGHECQHNRRCPSALAKKPHATQQSAVGYASSSKHDLLSRSQVFGAVNSAFVANAHARNAFFEIRLVDDQT